MTNHKQTRVLIVEDQAEARKLIHIAFRSPTFLVEEASTGYEALAMANESHPEVVLLDICLPGSLNGFEVCKELKTTCGMGEIFVILISGLSEPDDFEEARLAGANAYFVKPFRFAGIEKLIEQRRLRKENFTLVQAMADLEVRHLHSSKVQVPA